MIGVNERPGGSSLSGERSNDGIFVSDISRCAWGEDAVTQSPGGENDVDLVLTDDGRDGSGNGSGDSSDGLLGTESSSIGDRLRSRREECSSSIGYDEERVMSACITDKSTWVPTET